MNDRIKYWVWLNSLVKISPRKRYELLEHFKDPANIWYSSEEELKKLTFISSDIIDRLTEKQSRKDMGILLEKLAASGIETVTMHDRTYPVLLKHIYDPPVVIYVKGKLLENENCIAVVGSRRASVYGLDMGKKLSFDLSKNGLTVTSGMARGIDSSAHNGALEAGGRTIAVLGCGLDIVYPYENKELMNRICSRGAVISEFLPGIPPVPFNFPARNRIISGISYGVAVIEANEKSGSLITANYALEQGRDVFAVPGNINNRNSTGTNRLIKDGAKLVTDVRDILEEIKIFDSTATISYMTLLKKTLMNFSREEKTVVDKLANGPVHMDTIARECAMNIQMVGSILVMLELNGFVRQLPGKFYMLAE